MFSMHGDLGGKNTRSHPTDLLFVHSLIGDPGVRSHGDLSLLSRIDICLHLRNSVESLS
jgi:hypothetical protein